MADETKDPREAVLDSIVHQAWQAGWDHSKTDRVADSLTRLDAADPIRQVLPELVEALEHLAYEERAVPRFRKALLRLSADERLDDSEQEALAAAHSVLVALTRARKIMEPTDD